MNIKHNPAPELVVVNASQLVLVGEGKMGPRRGAEQMILDILEDGMMIIGGGRILEVGPRSDLIGHVDLSSVEVVNADSKIVMPGLIDAHTHPVFAGSRMLEYAERLAGKSRTEIASNGGGIASTVEQSRAANDATILANLRAFLAGLPRAGITTVEVKSGYGQTTEHELRHLQIIAEAASGNALNVMPTFLGAHIVPGEYLDSEDYVRLIIDEMLPAVASQGIATACDASCTAGSFSPQQCAAIVNRATALGMRSHVHADSSSSNGAWRTAVGNRALSADHLTYTPDMEIEEVGATMTAAVLVPYAELVYFTERRANARKFIEAGVPVVIATDYCSSVPAPNLKQVIPFAAAWYRMTPEEIVNAVTINAAHALGIGSETGSLTVGKRADFIIVDTSDYRSLAYEFDACRVAQTYISGELVSV